MYDKQLREEINTDREEHGKKPFDDDDNEPPMKEITVSTTDQESRLFRKCEHKKCFAYGAHTVCNRNNFILDVEVTHGNVHDSVVFDTTYDRVTKRFLSQQMQYTKRHGLQRKYLTMDGYRRCHTRD